MTKNTPMMDKGIAITGIMTERKDPKKMKITTATISKASIKAYSTPLMEALTKSEAS